MPIRRISIFLFVAGSGTALEPLEPLEIPLLGPGPDEQSAPILIDIVSHSVWVPPP
jgi:hypothetical protein